jgi:hypothetical protein
LVSEAAITSTVFCSARSCLVLDIKKARNTRATSNTRRRFLTLTAFTTIGDKK